MYKRNLKTWACLQKHTRNLAPRGAPLPWKVYWGMWRVEQLMSGKMDWDWLFGWHRACGRSRHFYMPVFETQKYWEGKYSRMYLDLSIMCSWPNIAILFFKWSYIIMYWYMTISSDKWYRYLSGSQWKSNINKWSTLNLRNYFLTMEF